VHAVPTAQNEPVKEGGGPIEVAPVPNLSQTPANPPPASVPNRTQTPADRPPAAVPSLSQRRQIRRRPRCPTSRKHRPIHRRPGYRTSRSAAFPAHGTRERPKHDSKPLLRPQRQWEEPGCRHRP
jgi:hypothetical protein